MSNSIQNQYLPDFVSPPGTSLQETIDALGMSQAELARRTDRPVKTINEIIKGKAELTPETALQLERVLQVPASFWNNRENQYRAFLAAEKEKLSLVKWVSWAKKMPYRQLIKAKIIPKPQNDTDLVKLLLNFFGVSNPMTLNKMWANQGALYRSSPAFKSSPEAISTWLRIGELKSQKIQCPAYDKNLFLKYLTKIRGLTTETPANFFEPLINYCGQAGVAVVFVRELPGVRVSGAARWLTPKKALIQLNLRYKRNDALWFSFFHEACHILIHGKREAFVDDDKRSEVNEREVEANNFASDFLIKPSHYKDFLGKFSKKDSISKNDIIGFAAEQGVHPGIVVGRLQHEKIIPYSHMRDLIMKLEWSANS